MHKLALGVAAMLSISVPAMAAGTLTAYPYAWDTSQAGAYVPGGGGHRPRRSTTSSRP